MARFDVGSLLGSNEKIVVVFSRGQEFKQNRNGRGTTGYWVCDAVKLGLINSVVIYIRNADKTNSVFKADVTGFATSGKRQLINFINCVSSGSTDLNWYEFTNKGSNPVKYFGF